MPKLYYSTYLVFKLTTTKHDNYVMIVGSLPQHVVNFQARQLDLNLEEPKWLKGEVLYDSVALNDVRMISLSIAFH